MSYDEEPRDVINLAGPSWPGHATATLSEPEAWSPEPPPPTADPDVRRPRTGLRLTAAVGAAALLAGGGGVVGARLALRDADRSGATVVGSPVVAGGDTAPTQSLAKIAAAVQPSVVSLLVEGMGGSGEGSGVILRSDGVVLTNNHVVEGASAITVRLSDGRTLPATLLGRDPATDLAVVKATGASGLVPATLGSSASLHVGDTVLAIGSPLGLDGSVTSGIVSALHRAVGIGQSRATSSAVSDAIQTDAAINPGNSGGPLIDAGGRVVGITTAIATLGSGASGSIGLGFAIPIDQARVIADRLVAGQTPQHAVLGVQVSDSPGGGALVESVSGAAQVAGLQPGDVVTGVDDVTVDDASELTAAIRSHRPGDSVTIHYRRGATTGTATARLGAAS